MNRRDFLKTGAAAAVSSTSGMGSKTKSKTRKPNLLFVLSDQHRLFSLPGEPFSQVVAPNFAAFREKNCSMEQCVSNYPLCSPYRGIFMSGLYPQQSGLMGNFDVLPPNVGPLGETFRKAGYHTGYIGKWHIHGQKAVGPQDEELIPKGPYRMGFEEWHVWADSEDHYHAWTFNQDTGEKIFPEGWNPIPMTDEAITFFKARPKDKPWFLVLAWNPPHPPFNPPSDDSAPYALDRIEFRPNVPVSPNGNKTQEGEGVHDDASLRKAAQGYMGAITGIDKEFARLLEALKETGQEEDTIVVYTSDHGEMMGSQGLMGKRVPFDESCRVPFLVRYPGVTSDRHKSNVLFAAVDTYPTLCGLAGVPLPAHCAGRDLSDAMRDRKIREPEYVFMLSQPEAKVPHSDGGKKTNGGRHGHAGRGGAKGEAMNRCPPYRGVRTKTHTYMVADTGRWLLYDNIADPYQMKNLVGDRDQQALMERLDTEVERWLHSVQDTFPYAEAKKSIFRLS